MILFPWLWPILAKFHTFPHIKAMSEFHIFSGFRYHVRTLHKWPWKSSHNPKTDKHFKRPRGKAYTKFQIDSCEIYKNGFELISVTFQIVTIPKWTGTIRAYENFDTCWSWDISHWLIDWLDKVLHPIMHASGYARCPCKDWLIG